MDLKRHFPGKSLIGNNFPHFTGSKQSETSGPASFAVQMQDSFNNKD